MVTLSTPAQTTALATSSRRATLATQLVTRMATRNDFLPMAEDVDTTDLIQRDGSNHREPRTFRSGHWMRKR